VHNWISYKVFQMSSFLFTFLEVLLPKTATKAKLPVSVPSFVRVVVHGPKETPWYVGAVAPNLDYEVPESHASKTPATCRVPAS